jgi:hypothetical protein
MTFSDKQGTHMTDAERAETQRLETLKDLVRRRAYDVPSEDVAARIIGHAIGRAAPAGSGHT